MSKKYGIFCMILGTALLAAALSLVFYNMNEDKKSWESAQGVLDELKAELPDLYIPTEPHTIKYVQGDIFDEYKKPTEPPAPTEAPTLTVLGQGYIGYISLPDLGIELPVMYDWSYPNLRVAPCRYQGSIADRNLIIAAHNYRSHFGRLNEYSGGEILHFIDCSGAVYKYEVTEVTEINGRDIDMMEYGAGKEWDLTLFTCTLGGQSRVTVRAVQVKMEDDGSEEEETEEEPQEETPEE